MRAFPLLVVRANKLISLRQSCSEKSISWAPYCNRKEQPPLDTHPACVLEGVDKDDVYDLVQAHSISQDYMCIAVVKVDGGVGTDDRVHAVQYL